MRKDLLRWLVFVVWALVLLVPFKEVPKPLGVGGFIGAVVLERQFGIAQGFDHFFPKHGIGNTIRHTIDISDTILL